MECDAAADLLEKQKTVGEDPSEEFSRHSQPRSRRTEETDELQKPGYTADSPQ